MTPLRDNVDAERSRCHLGVDTRVMGRFLLSFGPVNAAASIASHYLKNGIERTLDTIKMNEGRVT